MLSRTVLVVWCVFILQPLQGSPDFQSLAQESTEVPDVLVDGPRDFRRYTDRMKEALTETTHLTAASHLDNLFAIVARGDFFLVDKNEPLASGAKSELWRTTVNLPRPVLGIYEELKGSTAASQLQEALRDRDFDAIEAVADRWFATKAGGEARLLLARIYLDRGLPHEALNCLAPFPHSSVLSEPLQPELTLLRAVAYLLTGRPEEMKTILERLAEGHRGVTFRIGDHEVDLGNADYVFAELSHALGDPTNVERIPSRDWSLHRRDLRRSAEGSAMVPARCDWIQSLSAADENLQTISGLRDQFIKNDIPAVPSLSPIAVGNQVVFRTSTEIRAVDLSDGMLLWKFPPSLSPPQSMTADVTAEGPDPSETGAVYQRIWRDAIYGQLSSDGRYVYLIDELDLPEVPQSARVPPFALALPLTERPPPTNRLVALDLSRYGSFLWMVDEYHGKAKRASEEAFFLGPPLPVANSLYAIAEFDHQLSLVKLDAETGRQQWLLPYVEVSTDRTASAPRRTLTGVSPSYCEGILICPTNAGAVVAVDVATQRFLWGYCYAPSEPRQASQRLRNMPQVPQDWQDSSAIIVGHRVLITPSNADLQCLDLHTGKLLWSRRRSDLLFVAAADQDIVLLVGRHRFTGLRISDGAHAWKESPFVAIPAGGMPSGRGILSGRSYFLPTTDPELLQIDMLTGKTVRHKPTDQILGNLICSNGRIISQSPLAIACLGPQAADLLSVKNEKTASLSPQQIAEARTGELLRWLSHRTFGSREAASRELVKRGGDAIPELTVALNGDDPETTYRATAVLIQLLDTSDPDVAFQARQALVSGGGDEIQGSFAAKSLAREIHRREPLARKKLMELGATLDDSGEKVTLGPRWKGDNDGLKHLQWLSQLETLELRHGDINDKGLRLLRGLNSVQSLNLNRTQVTSEGIAHLVTLRGLRVLLLQKTHVDDRALPHLIQMKGVRAINLLDTDFTHEGVEELRRLMPNTQILF